jgi:hypothetical protein
VYVVVLDAVHPLASVTVNFMFIVPGPPKKVVNGAITGISLFGAV